MGRLIVRIAADPPSRQNVQGPAIIYSIHRSMEEFTVNTTIALFFELELSNLTSATYIIGTLANGGAFRLASWPDKLSAATPRRTSDIAAA